MVREKTLTINRRRNDGYAGVAEGIATKLTREQPTLKP